MVPLVLWFFVWLLFIVGFRLDEDGPLPSEKLMFCLLLGCGWEARLTSWWLCGI